MKKTIAILLMLFGLVELIQAQITLIPDPFFEDFLVDAGIDTDGTINGQVLTSDIADETNLAFWPYSLITDLTGIEDFSSLENLSFAGMHITELDLSQNTNLKFFNYGNTDANEIDLSHNINLIEFFASSNDPQYIGTITHIDFSHNISLRVLHLSYGFLTQLDVSHNVNLDQFEVTHMDDLISINLQNNVNEEIPYVRILDNTNLQCVQVDNPVAVIAGVDPPYDNWIIENNPVITEDCELGLEENISSMITLYPNPVKNVLHIANNNNLQINNIKIYDIIGKLLLEAKNTQQINVSDLESGVLFIKIQTNKRVWIKKVVKI